MFASNSVHNKEDEMGGACSVHGEMRYKILVGEPEGKRPLGRPSSRWEDSSETDLRKIGLEGVDWIHVAQDRKLWLALVNTVMNLRVP
jgi:hypothetical protein